MPGRNISILKKSYFLLRLLVALQRYCHNALFYFIGRKNRKIRHAVRGLFSLSVVLKCLFRLLGFNNQVSTTTTTTTTTTTKSGYVMLSWVGSNTEHPPDRDRTKKRHCVWDIVYAAKALTISFPQLPNSIIKSQQQQQQKRREQQKLVM